MTRVPLRILAAVLLLVASAVIGWRVLAPAEQTASAITPYPPEPSPAFGVTGRLNQAPLIVDRRLRVYAAKHQVRADGPVTARTMYTARWSFRRWPQQVSAVVASGATVVTRWSDGRLIALDARTGKVSWRADGPDAPDYAGHRTGAATVWTPPGLRLAGGAVVVTQDRDLSGYALSTGQRLWSTTVPAGCADGFTTDGGAYVCATGAYDAVTGRPAVGWTAGPYEPVGCVSFVCPAFRDGAGRGWLAGTASPRRAAGLDVPGSTFAAGVVVTPTDAGVSAASVNGGRLWERPGLVRVLGGTPATVLVLTPSNTLEGLDARTGALRYTYPMAYGNDHTHWKAGLYQVTDGYLAMERLRPDAPDDPESPIYYLTFDAVLVAVLPY
ncbi:PQQ-binding-like beta-propeller repeat protein [Actinoplanes sp. NPDC049802]|uniref:outer membrane protein assembly factor BamB family protein n=1 Tax=Actinoplanes sp. NPDC049802 TaxID=3154742 RepID=UPI0033F09E24